MFLTQFGMLTAYMTTRVAVGAALEDGEAAMRLAATGWRRETLLVLFVWMVLLASSNFVLGLYTLRLILALYPPSSVGRRGVKRQLVLRVASPLPP